MSYTPDDVSAPVVADVVAHTRNKNLTIDVLRPTVGLRLVRRLQRWCAARERRELAGSGPRVVVTEQPLENALVLQHLGDGRDVLDFGGFESTLPVALAALGRRVTVLDQRPYPFAAPHLVSLQRDVLQPQPDLAERFDVVYSISTLEHVGLGGYGSPVEADGDRIALAHLWSAVKPGGRLLFTVPAGRPTIKRGYRVYDEPALRRVMPADGRVQFFLKEGRYATWRPATAAEVAGHEYQQYLAQTPVEGVAFVVIAKGPAAATGTGGDTSS
jgi:SAM-dependent methyltransferase